MKLCPSIVANIFSPSLGWAPLTFYFYGLAGLELDRHNILLFLSLSMQPIEYSVGE